MRTSKFAALAAIASVGALAAASSSSASSTPTVQRSAFDRSYLSTAIEGDRIEIRGGRIALKRAGSPRVRDLARTLIRDHRESKHEAVALAHRYDVAIPPEPSPEQVWTLHTLRRLQGRRFDIRYAAYEIRDHNQDIDEASAEVEKGSNPEFREEAREELPMLRRHLRKSHAVKDAVTPGK
jgi:putative membrane protein